MAFKFLKKYFDIWVNDLLFLSLYSERETSQVVATFLLKEDSKKTSFGSYYSLLHQWNINLDNFYNFLSSQCTTKDIIKHSIQITAHTDAINNIVNGNDMWADKTIQVIHLFREKYLHNYSTLASNKHLAESNVKDVNYCAIIGRSEVSLSIYTAARSGLVEQINTTWKKSSKCTNNLLCGNANVTSGKYGCCKL